MTKPNTQHEGTHDLFAVRMQKLEQLREAGRNPFAANCEQDHTSAQALAAYVEGADDEAQPVVKIAGRIVVFRVMGKASFIKIQDREGQLQAYVTRDELPEGEYNTYFKKQEKH